MPKLASHYPVPLHGRIANVLGTATLNVTEIVQGLTEDGGDPKTRDRVSQALLDGVKAKRFVRATRGHYRMALEPDNTTHAPHQQVASNSYATERASNGRTAQRPADMAELRRLIRMYGTLAVRALLDEIEQE